jgi:2-haloacid dehalogenase
MNAAGGRFDTVVFDLGGVLIDWNPRHLYRRLFDDEAAMERFLAEVCTQQWNEQQDAGRSWGEAVATLSARYPQHAGLIQAYRARWEEMLGGPMAPSVAVLDELRGRSLRLYALTHWSHETIPVAWERYDFLHWFAGVMVSGEERLTKPDPAIFQRRPWLGRSHPASCHRRSARRKSCSVCAVTGAFAASEDSVRHDLRELAAQGLCRCVYDGGAAAVGRQARAAFSARGVSVHRAEAAAD